MSFIEGELTSIALCWELERADGAGLALTSHDRVLVREAVAYDPSPGMVPASIKRSLGLDPDNSEVSGALSADALDEKDFELGRWDGATMRLLAMDWEDDEAAPIALLSGEIGAVSTDGDGFSAELRGAAAGVNDPVCPATSPECRAQLGDKSCRVDLGGRTVRASVVAADGTTLTLDREAGDRFTMGRLRYLSGDNCGARSVILAATGSDLAVRDLPKGIVNPGCRVELREGCDKRLATCASRFANAANFRGEPHLPGNDLLTRYPGA